MCIIRLFLDFPSNSQYLWIRYLCLRFGVTITQQHVCIWLVYLKMPPSATWASAQLTLLNLGPNLPLLKDKRWPPFYKTWEKISLFLTDVCTACEVVCDGFGYVGDTSSGRTLPQMHLWPLGFVCEDFCINVLYLWVGPAKPAPVEQLCAYKYHALCITRDSSTETGIWR